MAGQWSRGYNGRYVAGHRDDAGIGNGDDVWGTDPADIEPGAKRGSVAILPGDVQFHEYGGGGELWGCIDRGQWGGDSDGTTVEFDEHTLGAGTDFHSGNADLYADKYTYEYAHRHPDEHADEYTHQHADGYPDEQPY